MTVKLSGLDSVSELAPNDLFYVVDTSEGKSCKVTLAELMAMMIFKRDWNRISDVVIDVVADATPIDVRQWGGGSVQLTGTHTNVYVYADLSEDGDGTYVQALDDDKQAIKLVIDGTKPTPLPDAVYKYPWIKLVSTVEDTGAVVFLKG